MAALRGPDSSEDERRLGEQAVFPETVDVNIRQLDPIPAPRAFLREQPLTDEMSELVLHSRQEIRDVLNGRDDRLLVIVGPCSIHDPKAAHEYAEKLAAVKRELEDRLVIVMRVYFEKPRTTIGWKGLINDPDLDGRFNIRKGMWLDGRVISAETKGNPDCHLVLRGSSHGPNYDAESVRQALEDLKVSKASGPSQHGLVIDAAHGNCGKDENREAEVIEEIAERLAHGEQGITGVMMESFLVGGHQKPAPLDQLVYGQSVTDSCVPWERTNELLHTLADAVTARRSAK